MKRHSYSEEEEILIIDLYIKLGGKKLTESNPHIINLCTLLNYYGYDCTISGILAKMSNLQSVDPKYIKNGKVGWSNISANLETLWNGYVKNNFANLEEDVVKSWKTVYSHKKQ